MKKTFKIGAFIICMITALWLVPKKVSAQNENINLQVFYDELGDYGTWVDNPDYGYVWVPNVDQDFKPYVTNGHWVFTDYGWTWSSDYPWGWAAFHYGRWSWDEQYGNVWVPGTEWGPAWVVWKKSLGYYGWAPMSPGMGTNYNQYGDIPVDSWTFVRDRDLAQYDLANYFVDRMRYNSLVRISSLILNTRYDTRYNHNYIFGPDRNEFQRYYGRTITPVHIYDNARPGKSMLSSDRFSIYRPQFSVKASSSYRESRPLSFIKNKEKINFTPNSYKSGRGNDESGRSNIQYNNNNTNNNNRNSYSTGRGNDQNNNNTNYNNRNSYSTGRGNVQNNNTPNNNDRNVNGKENTNTTNANTPNNNGRKADPIINGLKNILSGNKTPNNASNGGNANNNNSRQGSQTGTSGATTGRQGNNGGQTGTNGTTTGRQGNNGGQTGTNGATTGRQGNNGGQTSTNGATTGRQGNTGSQTGTNGATTGRQGNTGGQQNTGGNTKPAGTTGTQQPPAGTAGNQQKPATGTTGTPQKPATNPKDQKKGTVVKKQPITVEPKDKVQ